MKLKIFSLVAFLSVFAASLFAAKEAVSDDKGRVAEYSSNKIPLMLTRPGTRLTEMIFEKLEVKDGVVNFKLTFADGTPGEVYVPIDKKGVKFTYKITREVRAMRECYASGHWEDAVKAGRAYVYPSLPIMSVSEKVTNMHDNLAIFVECLVNANRYIEAKALMESLPLAKATPTVGATAVMYASKMVDLGRYEDAKAVLERLNFGGDNLPNIDKLMDLTNKLRTDGKYQEALQWYTKLQSTPENPRASEAKLWMAYCDVVRDNLITAELFLGQLSDMPKQDQAFSLKCLITGMLLQKANKDDEAIDIYAEGIVFGDISQNWMSELLFNTAMIYKKFEQFKSSNEIFEQIALLYPTENYAEKSKAQIVEIKEEPKLEEKEEEAGE